MSGLCGRNCEKCTFLSDCGGCSMCEKPYCENKCGTCASLCPERPGSFSLVNSIGGTRLTLLSNQHFEITLPSFLPVFPDRIKEKLDVGIIKVIGLHAGEMLKDSGVSITDSYLKKGYAGALNVSEDYEAVLQFYTKDRTLEGFYNNRVQIYQQIKNMKLKAVIAPNFSVYEDAPRVDHFYNMKRSSNVYNEMIALGIPAIPDISYYDIRDLEQWIREINNNAVKVISFSFQNVDVKLKASNLWKHYLLGFRILCQKISPDVDVIIVGVSSTRRIEDVVAAAAGRKIIILNQAAYVQSRRGMLSEGRLAAPNLSKREILIKNIEYFSKQYNVVNKGD